MTYEELTNITGIGESDFITGDTVIESGQMVENINGDGSLTLSWKSTRGGVIPAGTTLGDYVMLETYAPTGSGDGIYQWSPKFSDISSILGKTLFFKTVETTDGGTLTLYTFSYTGPASTLIADLQTYLSTLSGAWRVSASDALLSSEEVISVSFDGDTVKSAVTKIADACGVNVYYVKGTICIGMSSAYAADSYYNRFVVLGGTRNMAKKTPKGGYTAITQRLTIDDNGSIISQGTGPAMTKLLVFDDIYPKMELVITSTRYRLCYLLDENGNKISDGNGGYKQYAKWYIGLGIENADGGIDTYSFDAKLIIEGKPLGILFQSGPLTGREFELSYFDKSTTEKEKDDVSETGFAVQAGEYRIIMQADGDTLLPSLPADGTSGRGGLCPGSGQKITLTNVALDEVYIQKAKAELRKRGEAVAAIYSSGKIASYTEQTFWNDFLTEGDQAPELGAHDTRLSSDEQDGYIVTSVTTDLITGQRSVTYGTFTPKGLISSLIDKIDSVQLSGGGGTENEDYRGTAPMNIDQLIALQQAGGNIGMVTVNDKFKETEDQYKALNKAFGEVKNQADRQFNLWFGDYAPLPTMSNPTEDANYPASDWVTASAKKMHLQDIYYDTRRKASEGGLVWRWVSETTEEGELYYWQEVTDSDTLAALEKLSDVTSDGIICAGAEKTRILIEWNKALNEYKRLKDYAVSYGLDADEYYGVNEEGEANENIYTSYVAAFLSLAKMLNGGEEWDDTTLPLWLRDLNSDTVVPSADEYRATWNTYYDIYSEISQIITEDNKDTADAAIAELARMADDNVLSAVEKKAVIREYEKVVAETAELVSQAEENGMSEGNGSALYNYRLAYTRLWHYLNDMNKEVLLILDVTLEVMSAPEMLYNGENTSIEGSVFTDLWKQYHHRSEELRTALSAIQMRVFVSVELPTPPYKRGDLWRKLDTTNTEKGTMMVCVVGRTKGETALITDWTEFVTIEEAKEPRIAISVLIEKLLPYIDMKEVISLRLQSKTGATIGDICHEDGTVYICNGGGSFTEITGDETLPAAFMSAYTATNDDVIMVYGGDRPVSASKYDVFLKQITFTVAVTGETIEGGVEVSMYGDNAWEVISRPISGIIENLGSLIRLLVFGSGECNTVDAAGIITTKNFVEMFAKKVDGNDKTLAEAYLHASVEYDSEGKPVGIAKIKADQVVIDGDTSINEILHITEDKVWIGNENPNGVMAIVLNSDGRASFSGEVTASSGKIGELIIGSDGSLKSEAKYDAENGISYFELTAEGRLKVFEAEVYGTVYATSGQIGNVVIANGALSSNVIDGDGETPIFQLLADGTLRALKAEITGTIHATDGEFNGKVYATDGVFRGTVNATDGEFKNVHGPNVATDGGTSYNFNIDENGLLTASKATIQGDITADSLTLTNGLTVGGNFSMGADGTLNAKNVTIEGNITATSGSFTGEVIATCGSFAGEINATSGTIGGLIIDSNGIHSGTDTSNGHFGISKSGMDLSYNGQSIVMNVSPTLDIMNGGTKTMACLMITADTESRVESLITFTSEFAQIKVPLFIDLPKHEFAQIGQLCRGDNDNHVYLKQ